MNGTHQLLFSANVNLLVENTNTTKRNTEALLDFCKEVSLAVNTEKAKYMFMSLCQNTEYYHNNKDCYGVLENVTKLKYFRGTVSCKNYIHDEINNIIFGRY